MKHDMHPIVGDTKHGRGEHNKLFREKFGVHRLLLHAQKMVFFHPVLEQTIEVAAPFDTTFTAISNLFYDVSSASNL
jgi:tRNA pseudouridine65 synthase